MNGEMDIQLRSVVPVLLMHDVGVTKRFYVDYLGCTLDWQEGEGDRPIPLKRYPFLNPGIEQRGSGRELCLIDPASNRIRF